MKVYFLLIIVICWIYFMQFYKIQVDQKIFVDHLIQSKKLKTGDLILFKAYNNYNSIIHGSYFGHIGMVYIMDGIPYLFEANGIEKTPLLCHHSKKGVFLTKLADRVRKYKGRAFLKPLNNYISPKSETNLSEFIHYALLNMQYDKDLILNSVKKALDIKRCDKNTDCGQIMFLSLIKMGLLDLAEYEVPRLNHLKYVCDLQKIKNGYYYSDLIEIIDHPFDY